MKLWSDYEGRTIAEAYPLKKLVRPEGRSAFFLTTNGTGTPALVRVIEAHFDESEILTRWRTISEIGQENLVVMRKFGETELDGTPLVYAVMEPTEISLAELLENRTLTVEETRQLAHSLVGALQALHAHGLVHGLIEPANILAAGELVKLRSDCVREAVEDPDGAGPNAAELKAADAHAVAVVLLQALTGRRILQGSATLLPPPFDAIIRNGLSGRWGLTEMATALGPAPAPVAPAPAPPAAETAKPVATAATPQAAAPVKAAETAAASPKPETAATPTAAASATAASKIDQPAAASLVQENLFGQAKTEAAAPAKAQATPMAQAAPIKKPGPAGPAASSSAHSPRAVAESLAAAPVMERKPLTPAQAPEVRHRVVRPVETDPKRTRMWIAIAAAVLILLILGWRMMRSEPTATANGAAKPISTLADPDTGSHAPAATTAKPSANTFATGRSPAIKPSPVNAAPVNAASDSAASAPAASAAGRTQWRVVAYTYNHQDQAQQKADSIARKHPSLHAEVFSPTGRAPYLVTVGGPMSREQAEAFKQKARSEGLPHDIYAQNYLR